MDTDTDADDVARAVLAKASANDQTFTMPDPTVIAAWAEHMHNLAPADALAAVTEHYDRETRRIMPADVRKIATRLANERHDRNRIREITQAPNRTGQKRALELVRETFKEATGIETTPRSEHVPFAARRARRSRMQYAGPKDSERTPDGNQMTVCFRCVKDIPAPTGWDPADPTSQRLYCGTCQDEIEGGNAS